MFQTIILLSLLFISSIAFNVNDPFDPNPYNPMEVMINISLRKCDISLQTNKLNKHYKCI